MVLLTSKSSSQTVMAEALIAARQIIANKPWRLMRLMEPMGLMARKPGDFIRWNNICRPYCQQLSAFVQRMLGGRLNFYCRWNFRRHNPPCLVLGFHHVDATRTHRR